MVVVQEKIPENWLCASIQCGAIAVIGTFIFQGGDNKSQYNEFGCSTQWAMAKIGWGKSWVYSLAEFVELTLVFGIGKKDVLAYSELDGLADTLG